MADFVRVPSKACISQYWVFTWNNPPSDELEFDPASVVYAAWQREVGELGTPHLQGYIEFKVNQRRSAVSKLLPGAWLQPRRGSQYKANQYATKSETRVAGPWTFGCLTEVKPRQRSDIAACVDAYREGGMKRASTEFPEVFAKYSRGIKATVDAQESPPKDLSFKPRPWQARVLERLQQEPNDRTIYWITDRQGNQGKSRLAKHLVIVHDAAQLSGKVADMAYGYNKERIVIFDLTRTNAEMMDYLYDFAEKLKNGYIYSTKYECRAKIFDPPHVLFLSNASYDRSKWTSDRCKEIDLSESKWHMPLSDLAPLWPAAAPCLAEPFM